MKKIIAGAFALLAIVGLLSLGQAQEKRDNVAEKPKGADDSGQITLTLPPPVEAATRPASQRQVRVEIVIPTDDLNAMAQVVRAAKTIQHGRTTVVVRASSKESFVGVAPILTAAVRGGASVLDFESDTLSCAMELPSSQEGRGDSPGMLGAPQGAVLPPIRVDILAEGGDGRFRAREKSYRKSEDLGKTLAGIAKEPDGNRLTVIIAPAPKAAWGDVVIACKTVKDAGFVQVHIADAASDGPAGSAGATLGPGIPETQKQPIRRVHAGEHYGCSKCGHEFVTKEVDGRGALDCPSCGKKNAAFPQMQCEDCGKWFVPAYILQGKKPGEVRNQCPHCGRIEL